jgi:hypothetical protein
MSLGVLLADFPYGALSGMLGLALAIPVVILCSAAAWAMRQQKRERAFRAWLVAVGLCVVVWVGWCYAAQALGLP